MQIRVFLVVLGLLACGSGRAESLLIASGGASNETKVPLQFQTRLEPYGDRSQVRGLLGGVVASNPAIHRYLSDKHRGVYYGYDIRAEPQEDDSTLRVTILPLSVEPSDLHMPESVKWTKVEPPRYPPPQTVKLGDTLAFDLFVNPSTGQRVVEYVLFGRDHRMETASGATREFTVHDVDLALRAPRFTRNGEMLADESKSSGLIRGHFVILFLPPHGRFILSLAAHPERGFAKAGEVRGSTLTFEAGGAEYRVNCEGKIAPGVTAYDLYVRHDPAYRPSGGSGTEVFFGTSDAFEGSR